MNEAKEFAVRRVENGWVLLEGYGERMHRMGYASGPEYVFKTLDEMNDWLKAKYESKPDQPQNQTAA